MDPALEAIRGQSSAHSLATGPATAEPFISPLLLTITPALSSKWMKTPSFLRKDLRCLTMIPGITFLRSSGFPFFTEHITMSPDPAFGRRFNRPPILHTAIILRFFAPELSAQFTTAAVGRPAETLCLIPAAAARPLATFSLILFHFNGRNKKLDKTYRMLCEVIPPVLKKFHPIIPTTPMNQIQHRYNNVLHLVHTFSIINL
mmetsp:Transcript_7927/g.19144  ORF Transcript_7927/g.19144 Transcript_7927/m.19144 type:complete len:203 (+) Transcript_7927:2346-2954(+)